MELKQIVQELVSSGMSEKGIATALSAKGVAVTQPTIHRIKVGQSKNTFHQTADALRELHRRRLTPKSNRIKRH